MDTIFMSSENSKTSKRHVLILNLIDKIDLRRGEKHKNHVTIINLKYLLQHRMMNLNYQMDHILYQLFKIILIIFKKRW